MTRVLLSFGLVMAFGATAMAQETPREMAIATFDPDSAVAAASMVEGPGWKVGEGTTIHPVIGIESGVVSNVFYDPTQKAAGILRILAQVGAGSLSGVRMNPATPSDSGITQGDFEYRLSARFAYDQILSGDPVVRSTGGLGIGLLARGLFNPLGKLTFGADESYERLIRAANFETDANTNRDINTLGLTLLYHPPGASLSGALYYNNTLDIFEKSTQSFADRMDNRIGLRGIWRWLPQTVVSADVSEGVTTGIGLMTTKVTSFPLVAKAGIATLLNVNTTVNLSVGYTNGFYARGPSYSGVMAGAAIGYRYSPLGRAGLTYDLMYADSINANFYRDHILRVYAQQAFLPFVVLVQPELHFRQYNGLIIPGGALTRDDVIFAVVGGIHYNLRDSFAATLDYRFSTVNTSFRYNGGTDPSFTRHELLAGVRWAM